MSLNGESLSDIYQRFFLPQCHVQRSQKQNPRECWNIASANSELAKTCTLDKLLLEKKLIYTLRATLGHLYPSQALPDGTFRLRFAIGGCVPTLQRSLTIYLSV